MEKNYLINVINLLKTPKEAIKRQMGHIHDKKFNNAYDKSKMLEERLEFLNKWCDLCSKWIRNIEIKKTPYC